MAARWLGRALTTVACAVAGAVLLSGSDQPVTAHPYPHWQQLAAPPISPRTHALGVHVRHRVVVLGGFGRSGLALRDGAAYDVRTGLWHRLRTPAPITDRDRAAVAAGVVVLRHRRPGLSPSWWRYDVRRDDWSRMGGDRLVAPGEQHRAGDRTGDGRQRPPQPPSGHRASSVRRLGHPRRFHHLKQVNHRFSR